MSPAGKQNAKRIVTKVKNAGFWQKFNRTRRKNSRPKTGSDTNNNTRELRGHEHPKEPERNKK